jgi:hypothetical protein
MLRSTLVVPVSLVLLCALTRAGEEGFVGKRFFWRPYENRYGIVVMAGNVEGQQPHYGWYWNDTSGMYRFLVDEGFLRKNVYFLAYGKKARKAKDIVCGASTTQEIRRVFRRVASHAKANDLVCLYWIDHGNRRAFDTYDGAIGHDEIGRLVRAIKAKVFIGAFNPCNSGAVIDDIKSRNAIILTSVLPHEGNAWGWAGHWLEALAGGKRRRSSDLDLDGRITIAEAYEWTTTLANRAGEHPLLDDNGDGRGGDLSRGTFAPGDNTEDGTRASQHALDAWLDAYPSCISWGRAAFSTARAEWPANVGELEAFLREQSFVKSAMRDGAATAPILIYCYSRERVQGKPTPQAVSCRAVNREVFSYPDASTVPILGRSFRCYEVDVSDLDPRKSPLVNGRCAPVVIVLDKTGRLSGLLRWTISDTLLYRELEKVLSEEQCRAIDRCVRAVAPALGRIRRLQEKVTAKRKHLATIVARFQGRPLEDRRPARRRARDALLAAEAEHADAVDDLRAQLGANR